MIKTARLIHLPRGCFHEDFFYHKSILKEAKQKKVGHIKWTIKENWTSMII